ncbi:MAG: AEC family transporter [Pseudomonadota bacterium]
MGIVLHIFNTIAPVVLTVSVGAIWVWVGRPFPTEFITTFATRIAVPALIVSVLAASDLDPTNATTLFGAAFVSYILALAVFCGLLAGLGLSFQTYLAPMTFGNTGNLGLPLALFAFGDEGLASAVIIFTVTSVLAFTAGVAIVAGQVSGRRVFQEPILWATLLGVGLLFTDTDVPDWLMSFLDLVGQMAIPLVLVTLGVSLARLRAPKLPVAAGLSCAKIALCAAVAWGVGVMFGLPPLARSVLILQMATPVAVTSYMLAELYDAEPEAVAALVMTSTLIFLIVLPPMLSVLI